MSAADPAPFVVASGLGPLPGTDPRDAAGWVLDTLADDLPHVPQLPARGPWAEALGRAAALLVDLPVEVSVDRWQVAARAGRDLRRAVTTLAEDLDALEQHWADRASALKLQVLGPWSLAASLERRSGEVLAADARAVADVAVSLGEGVAAHVADVTARLAGLTEVTLQVDEPVLSALLAGRVATRSGLATLPAPDAHDATRTLASFVGAVRAAGAQVVVATEPRDAAVTLARGSGAAGWCGDLTGVADAPLDALGAWVEQGARVVAGSAVLGPTRSVPPGVATALAEQLRARWRRWGLSLGDSRVVVVASDDLVAGQPGRDVARAAYREVVTAVRRLRDEEG